MKGLNGAGRVLRRAYWRGRLYVLVHSDDIDVSVDESIAEDDTADTTFTI
jgi:hypothetical protein